MQEVINADGYLSTGASHWGCNMYTYCLSNPVNMVDINGEHPEWLLKLAEETGSMASAASIAGEYRRQTVAVKSTKQKPKLLGVTATSLVIVAIVVDDVTLVGIANDVAILPTIVV